MTTDELVKLIKVWLKNVRDGHLEPKAFITVVESLIDLYYKGEK